MAERFRTKEIKWFNWGAKLMAWTVRERVSRKIPGAEGRKKSGNFIFVRSTGTAGEAVYTILSIFDSGLEYQVQDYNGGYHNRKNGGSTTYKRRCN